MSVYVDRFSTPFRGMKMCHMLADSLSELHDMADKIGLHPDWFQCRPFAHYDVCKAKRRLAVKHGAIEVTRKQVGALTRRPNPMNHPPRKDGGKG